MSAMLESLLTPTQRADACKADTLAHYAAQAAQATTQSPPRCNVYCTQPACRIEGCKALPPIPAMPSDSPLWRAVIAHGDEQYSDGTMAALNASVAAVEAAVADMLRAYALEALAMRRAS